MAKCSITRTTLYDSPGTSDAKNLGETRFCRAAPNGAPNRGGVG